MEHGVSEGMFTMKTDDLRECIISYYWYFLRINCKSEVKACDKCYDMTQKVMRFDDVAIVSVGRNHYRIQIVAFGPA